MIVQFPALCIHISKISDHVSLHKMSTTWYFVVFVVVFVFNVPPTAKVIYSLVMYSTKIVKEISENHGTKEHQNK